MNKPTWMSKHPCAVCGVGYGECVQGLRYDLMCCERCAHPSRWLPDPYTAEEFVEMTKPRRL